MNPVSFAALQTGLRLFSFDGFGLLSLVLQAVLQVFQILLRFSPLGVLTSPQEQMAGETPGPGTYVREPKLGPESAASTFNDHQVQLKRSQ